MSLTRWFDAMREPDPTTPPAGKKDPLAEAAELRSRLDALKADLGDAVAEEEARDKASGNAPKDGGAIGTGLRAGSELVAGVIVGGGIGYLIDRQVGTSPLFLIVMMMFGMAAGFWNVYRLAARRTTSGRDGK